MLGLLALANNKERSRVWLQEKLWGTRSQKQAQSSLRKELSNLRKMAASAGIPLIETTNAKVRLVKDGFLCDLDERLPETVEPSDFLEGIDIPGEDAFEDWLRETRSNLRKIIADRQQNSTTSLSASAPQNRADLVQLCMQVSINGEASADDQNRIASVQQKLGTYLAAHRWLNVVMKPILINHQSNGILEQREGSDATVKADYMASILISLNEQCLSADWHLIDKTTGLSIWYGANEIAQGSHSLETECAKISAMIVIMLEQTLAQKYAISDSVHAPAEQVLFQARQAIHTMSDAELEASIAATRADLSYDKFGCEFGFAYVEATLLRHIVHQAPIEDKGELATILHSLRSHAPMDFRSPYLTGIYQTWLGNKQTASEAFEVAETLYPMSAKILGQKGILLMLSGSLDEALNSLRVSDDLSNFSQFRYLNISYQALCHFLNGDMKLASDLTHRIYSVLPDRPLTHLLRILMFPYELEENPQLVGQTFRVSPDKASKCLSALSFSIHSLKSKLESEFEACLHKLFAT